MTPFHLSSHVVSVQSSFTWISEYSHAKEHLHVTATKQESSYECQTGILQRKTLVEIAP